MTEKNYEFIKYVIFTIFSVGLFTVICLRPCWLHIVIIPFVILFPKSSNSSEIIEQYIFIRFLVNVGRNL